MLRLCPFFKEIDEICRGNANVASPFVLDSTNSVSVLEEGGNFEGDIMITESEEEYPLNQPSWVAATATPLQSEDQLDTPSLHGRISYKELVSGNPGMESVKVPPNYLTQVFHSENSKQQSEIEVECLSSSNHSERIQPATLPIVSKIDTSGKTNRKLSQPLSPSSKNRKTPFDHEVRANDELEEMPDRPTLVTVNKVDSFDHFGKYVSSILRSLRKQSALRLQKNISNMITKTICPPADFSRNNNSDGDIEEDEDHCYVGHITTINRSTMISENGLPKKRSRKLDDFDKLISLAHKHLVEPQTEFDKIASIWAIELQKMKPQQQLFAKKAVNDVLFEGQLGTLQKGSLQINSARYTPDSCSSVQRSPVHCRAQQEQSVRNAHTEPVIANNAESSNAPQYFANINKI